MERTLPFALLASAAIALGGCSIAGTVAATAVSALTSAGGGGGAPVQEVSPGDQLKEALAGLDDKVSPACAARLRRVEGPEDRRLPAGTGGGENRPASQAPRGVWAGFQPAGVAPRSPQTPAGPSRETHCAVRPTCLPGAAAPVAMLVCERPDLAAG